MILLRSFLSGHIRIKRTLEYYDAGIGPRVPFGGGFGPTVSANFAVALGDYTTLSITSSMPDGGLITRAGNAMLYDSTGKLTWAPNNQYINSGSATNTARTITTVAGVNYYIWIQTSTGTATIVASGTNTTTFNGSTSGTYTAFTATAGTLTLTPTSNFANITQVVVAQITYETALRSGDNVVTGASAYYGPRFDYDPATLAAKGLLVEGTRTNLVTYSEQFDNAAWVKSGGGTGTAPVVTANQAISPDGTQNADLVTFDAGSNGGTDFSNMQGSTFSATAQPYTFSVWLRTSDGTTKTVQISISGAGASVVTVTGSWQRFTTTWTASVGSWNARIRVGGGVTGATASLYVFGAQVEAANFPSSYIPTVASSVARAAETFTLANYTNRLVESFYIDEATGGSWSANIAPSATSPLTISTPSFGWVTSLRPYTNAYAGDISTPSWIDNSGTTSNRMYYDSTGMLTWAPANMLLNSASLSTQTVTVTSGATNILSFSGTGSITYSGAASGTLSGTGVSNRVSVVLTMTTASLTLTVSGSVTSAQLERVTYQTSPRAYIPTTSAAVYQPRYDYDPSVTSATPRGMLIEESRTNFVKYSERFDVSNSLVVSGLSGTFQNGETVTATGGGTGKYLLSGSTSTLILLSGGSGTFTGTLSGGTSGATATISSNTIVWTPRGSTTVTANAIVAPDGTTTADKIVPVSSGATNGVAEENGLCANGRTVSFYAKAGEITSLASSSGAGENTAINLITGVITGNAVYTNLASMYVGNGWWRFSYTYSTAAGFNLYIGAASGVGGSNGFYLWGAQIELGTFPTSYTPTTTASVTRVADVVKLSGSALTTLQGSQLSVISQASTFGQAASSPLPTLFNVSDGTTANYYRINSAASYGGRLYVNASSINQINSTTGSAPSNYQTFRFGCALQSSNFGISYNGASTVATASGLMPVVNQAAMGNWFSSSGTWLNGYVQSLALYNQRLPDTVLKAKSVVGSPY